MFHKMNGYFEEIKEKKESKEKISMKNCGLKSDLIRSVTNKSDDCDEKCIKIKLDSDDKLRLNKAIEIPVMIIVVRAIFYENKYYSQVSF